ncbi:MAG: sulfatase-like hydrolase/transferase [Myxococcota bacterium]|nr:sulfatase-like hydrolase/transferase [Myxococcota bacterium]
MRIITFLLACQTETVVSTSIEEEKGPDVLLITIDTLRADRLGAYGDSLARTPNIDSLALESALFREAHTHSPLTLPAHASILTGLYPNHHGVRDNAGFALSDDQITIAERLKEKGYQTGAFVSAFVLEHSWGLDQGFDRYHDPFHPSVLSKVRAFGEAEIPSAETINAALSWWKSTASPKFAWVHLYDPHTPWEGKEGDPYRSDVAQADRNLSRLLKAVPSSSLIVLTSDHGESLWEHGEREHGILLHRSVTRVPLLIRPPKGLQGRENPPSISTPLMIMRPEGQDEQLLLEPVPNAPKAAKVLEPIVRSIDIAPTIADYVGVDWSSDGKSLRGLIEGKEEEERVAYAETIFPFYQLGWSPLKMVQNEKQRIESGLYHKATLWKTSKETIPKRSLLAEMDQRFGDRLPVPGSVSLDQQAALEALGYMSGGQTIVQEADPRDKIDVLTKLAQAEQLPPQKAIAELRTLIEKEPQLLSARVSLVLAHAANGDANTALQASEELLAIEPNHTVALNNAALLSLELGDHAKALAYAKTIRLQNEKDARSYRIQTAVYVAQEEPQKVIAVASEGLKVAPSDPNLHYLIALSYLFENQFDLSLHHLDEAKKNRAIANDISLWRAIAHERKGDIDSAKKWYEQASFELKGDLRPWAMGGVMLAQHGRCKEAKSFLINAAKRGASRDPKIAAAIRDCQIDLR